MHVSLLFFFLKDQTDNIDTRLAKSACPTERIIVHRSIAEFREALKVAVNNILEGPNAELVAINACDIVKNKDLVRDAISKGGRILLGDLDTQVAPATRMRTIVVEMDIYHAQLVSTYDLSFCG